MTSKEVCIKLGMSHDTLRYYERIGLLPRIKRDEKGYREFDESDCKLISFIKCMRGAGMSIKALMEYFELFQQGDETITARKELLEIEYVKMKKKKKEIEESMDRLEKKILIYEEQEKNK